MHTIDIWVINKRVLRKFLASNFAFSDTEDNTSGPLNRWGIANLPVLRTLIAIHHKSQEPSFCEVIHSFVLIAYTSLVASRTLLEQFLACPNFPFDSEDLFCWYKQTKWFIWTVATKKTSWKPWRWVTLDLILTMRDIYIDSTLNSLTKFTRSNKSTEFKDILPWNISPMITKTIPISTRILISSTMK